MAFDCKVYYPHLIVYSRALVYEYFADLAMDFIEPVFGNQCIQYMNGEEAKLRRQRYDYFMNSEFVSMYFPSFVEVKFHTSTENIVA